MLGSFGVSLKPRSHYQRNSNVPSIAYRVPMKRHFSALAVNSAIMLRLPRVPLELRGLYDRIRTYR